MSDLDFFLIFFSYLLSFMTQYLICKNDSLKNRLYILEKENKEMEEIIYGSKSN